jgi:hypothetical protein
LSVYLLLRTLKWLGMLAYGAGLVGALGSETPAGRSKAVQLWATLGFALLWFSGWGLARLTGVSLGSAYLSASMALSLLSMQLLIWSTERRSPELARAPGRIWAGRLAAVLSVAVIVLMVARPGARPTRSPAPAASPVPSTAAPSQP